MIYTIHKVITQGGASKLSQSELLTFLKQFEGVGRSKSFSKKAATREKRKKGESSENDFSWSWLTNYASQMAMEYGSDQKWHIQECEGEKKKEIIVINRKETIAKKRTEEASEQVWKVWDEKLEVCRSGNLPEQDLYRTYVIAWNKIVKGRKTLLPMGQN